MGDLAKKGFAVESELNQTYVVRDNIHNCRQQANPLDNHPEQLSKVRPGKFAPSNETKKFFASSLRRDSSIESFGALCVHSKCSHNNKSGIVLAVRLFTTAPTNTTEEKLWQLLLCAAN